MPRQVTLDGQPFASARRRNRPPRRSDTLSKLFGSIDECFFTLDRNGIFNEVNKKAASWFQMRPTELLDQHYRDVLPRDAVYFALCAAIDCGQPSITEQKSSLWPDHWVEARFYPFDLGISVFLRDVSERKREATEVVRSRALLQATTDAVSAHVAILDASGTIMSVNEPWRQFHLDRRPPVGFRVGDSYLAGLESSALFCPDAKILAEGLRAVLSRAGPDFRADYHDRDAGNAWFQVHMRRFDAIGAVYIAVTYEDISHVRKSERALQRLAGRLLTIQDASRRQIARDLHDTTAQNLLCAALAVQHASSSIPPEAKEAAAFLAEADELITTSQNEIRTLCYLLHPPMLDEVGLPAALRWFISAFSQRTQLSISLDIDPEVDALPLPTVIETALFRVAQEAMTNVHRHSGSKIAKVKLDVLSSPDGKRLRLEVADEGRGIPPFAVPAERGIGLMGMAERMRLVHGNLIVERNGERGTSVVASILLRIRMDH